MWDIERRVLAGSVGGTLADPVAARYRHNDLHRRRNQISTANGG